MAVVLYLLTFSCSITQTLKLTKPKNKKRVQWDANTVDNEFLNRKSSKCCCIYSKHVKLEDRDASSSDDDDVNGGDQKCEKKKGCRYCNIRDKLQQQQQPRQ
ncbi:uncharacterized protein TRIADDRAFT_56042 [Trichoplax adhaerens]|uniref:E3 ubiquitin-protein ligase PPP1R11 n=1 Tax=Trichoplax adhaerens TaxID=10228 RepID=B3RTT7_TRIAD|nr:predicted protein [Trichoplax adhaerens]EDV25682.1 predicted protein [Trichoplax adhaerens]|eukprot:XP_002111715.1 predicted protein [Trichoplax adhaerens]